MRVFVYSTGADTGGVSIAIKRAFDRESDWTVNSMVASQNYIGYPVDEAAQPIVNGHVTWRPHVMERLYDNADVIQLNNTLHGHRWYDRGQGKPTVLMHHGWMTKDFPAHVREAREIGALQTGSTLDLALMEPDLEWVPPPVDLAELRRLRAERYRADGTIRIGHAPTNRAIKGSDAFDRAIVALQQSGLPVVPVVIEGVSHAECLRRKATVDIYFDQPTLGYGVNAIEAWAMGIPVVCGIADPAMREGMIARWGRLPFMEGNEATLEDALRALVADPELRAEYAQRGTDHVERWHSGTYTVQTLQRIWAAAPATVPGGAERRIGGHGAARLARRDALIARAIRPRVPA